jgi:hypothetical protein
VDCGERETHKRAGRERESGRKNKFMILLLVEKWKGERIFSNNRE